MKRKLIKQGTGTMMISLPSKWVKEHNLAKGAEINLEVSNDTLVISAREVVLKSETSIHLTELTESSIRTSITNTYRSGFDKVKIYFTDEKQFAVLNEVVKTRLLGFEIVKKSKDYCLVENITEPSLDQFDTIVHKIFFNISELLEITKRRMNRESEFDNFWEVEERIQKYDNFCRRVISKRKFSHKHPEFLWSFLSLINHGQREIYLLNKILDGKVSISLKTKDFLGEAIQFFTILKEAYLESDLVRLTKLHSQEKILIYKKAYNLLQHQKGLDNVFVYHIAASIRRFYQANSPLSGLLMSK